MSTYTLFFFLTFAYNYDQFLQNASKKSNPKLKSDFNRRREVVVHRIVHRYTFCLFYNFPVSNTDFAVFFFKNS